MKKKIYGLRQMPKTVKIDSIEPDEAYENRRAELSKLAQKVSRGTKQGSDLQVKIIQAAALVDIVHYLRQLNESYAKMASALQQVTSEPRATTTRKTSTRAPKKETETVIQDNISGTAEN